MIRIIFVFIMSIHGLIHLMGFLKEWKLAEVKELSGKTIIPLSENLPITPFVTPVFFSLASGAPPS